VSDSTLKAVVAKNVQAPLKQHVNLHAGRFATFEELQEFVVDFVRAQTPWKQSAGTTTNTAFTTGPSAMEVDLVKGGKGKGKYGKKAGGLEKDKTAGYKGPDSKGKGKDYASAKGKGKGKSDAKAGTVVKFDGYCGKCGKYGHKQSECWCKTVNNVGEGQHSIDAQDEEARVMRVSSPQEKEIHALELLVDSGAFGHVAPEWFAPEIPVIKSSETLKIFAADGRQIKHLGYKVVSFGFNAEDGTRILVEARFAIVDVKRPILSVKRLQEAGYVTEFGPKGAYLSKGGVSNTNSCIRWSVCCQNCWIRYDAQRKRQRDDCTCCRRGR
jgi:hypothetical protein